MSNRIGKRARGQLVDLRMAERHFGKLGTTATYGGRTATIGELVARKMIRRIGTSWEDTSTGGKVERTRYALTDRGRVVADQLLFNLKTSRSASDLLDDPDLVHYRVGVTWRKPERRHWARTSDVELRFRGSVGLQVWPAPDELEERCPNRTVVGPEAYRHAADTTRAWTAELAKIGIGAPLVPAHAYPSFALIPSEAEPLDRVLDVLENGYAFTEDAHRRIRQLEAARRVHDDGDADDGAIARAIRTCEQQLRAQILGMTLHVHTHDELAAISKAVGNGHLRAEPMLLRSWDFTVSAAELEAARRQPLCLVEIMRMRAQIDDAPSYGGPSILVDVAAETRKDGDK